MVIWKKQNEESLKETKALPHWIVMGASISKLSTTEQRTPSKQNKTKPTNNATSKVNVKRTRNSNRQAMQ